MARPNVFFVTLLLLVGRNLFLGLTDAEETYGHAKHRQLIQLKSDISSEDPDEDKQKEKSTALETIVTTVEKVKDRLKKSEAMSLVRKLVHIGSALSPLIPGFGQIFTFANNLLARDENEEALTKGFDDIYKATIGLVKGLKELDNMVDQDLIYHLFSSLKENILYFGDLINVWIMAKSVEHRQYLETKIVTEYKRTTGFIHLQNLFHNIMGKDDATKAGIMYNVKRTSDCHPGTLERYGESLLWLMMQGINNHQAYMNFRKKDPKKIKTFEEKWMENFVKASSYLNDIVEECSNSVLNFIASDIETLRAEFDAKEHNVVATAILNKLIYRSSDYYWLVIVYTSEDKYVGVKGEHFRRIAWQTKQMVVVFKEKQKQRTKPRLNCNLLKEKLDKTFFFVEDRKEEVFKIHGVSTAVVMNRKGLLFVREAYPVNSAHNFPEGEICIHYDSYPHAHAGWIV